MKFDVENRTYDLRDTKNSTYLQVVRPAPDIDLLGRSATPSAGFV